MKTETYTSTRQWFQKIVNTPEPEGWLRGLLFFFYLFSLVYLLAVQVRIVLFRSGIFKTYRLPRRVISVGNLTVGGTGKTPTVLSLAKFFQRQNVQVAILSRGYKRERPKSMCIVSDGQKILASPALAGEEAYFLAHELNGVIVAVGSDRYLTGLLVLRQFPVDVFIMDDGFQHLRLHRDSNILLLDHENPLGNGYLLPRGILREPASSVDRASLILLTKKDLNPIRSEGFSFLRHSDMIPVHSVTFVPDYFMNMLTSERYTPESLKGTRGILVSGIGNPKSFLDLVEKCQIQVERELVFPDHHFYQSDDIEAIYDIARFRKVDYIITTDKDAVKLAPHLRKEVPVLILKIKMLAEDNFPWEDLKNGKI